MIHVHMEAEPMLSSQNQCKVRWVFAALCMLAVIAPVGFYFLGMTTRSRAVVVTGPAQAGALLCAAPHVDFGTKFRPTPTVSHTFQVENRSRETVTVRVAQKTCTCATVKITPSTLEPGEIASVEVEWEIPNGVGRVGFAVLLTDKKDATEALQVTGGALVRDVLRITPEVIDLGQVAPDEMAERLLEIADPEAGALPASASIAIEPPEAVELRAELAERTSERTTFRVTVTGVAGGGQRSYALRIKTGLSLQPEFTVPVTALHLAEFIATPSAVLINRPKAGDVTWVTLKSSRGRPFEVASAEADDPAALETRIERASDGTVRIGLTPKVDATAKGHRTGKVLVRLAGVAEPVTVDYLIVW